MFKEKYVDTIIVKSIYLTKLYQRLFQTNSIEDQINCYFNYFEYYRSSLWKKKFIWTYWLWFYDW